MLRPRRLTLLLVVWAAGVLTGASLGVTRAAFSATTENTGSSFGTASSFCASPGTQTVPADADTYVVQDNATQTNGGSSSLQVKSQATKARRALIRFALPALPARCTVTGATLRLNASSAVSGRTIEAVRAAAAWSESSVSWITQPAATGAVATAPSASGWVEWAVTSQVAAMYPTANFGFILRDANELNATNVTQQFVSRSGTTALRPQLILTFG